LSNIGLAAVLKLLLAIDCRPPLVLPSSSSSFWIWSVTASTFGSLNGIWWLTHWL